MFGLGMQELLVLGLLLVMCGVLVPVLVVVGVVIYGAKGSQRPPQPGAGQEPCLKCGQPLSNIAASCLSCGHSCGNDSR